MRWVVFGADLGWCVCFLSRGVGQLFCFLPVMFLFSERWCGAFLFGYLDAFLYWERRCVAFR